MYPLYWMTGKEGIFMSFSDERFNNMEMAGIFAFLFVFLSL